MFNGVDFSSFEHLVRPYRVTVTELKGEGGFRDRVRITLHDDRPRNKNKEENTVSLAMNIDRLLAGDTNSLITRALLAGKSKLQKQLAATWGESELRLWAAENRDIDLMDGKNVPPNIRAAWAKQLPLAQRHITKTGHRKNVVQAERERLERARAKRIQVKEPDSPAAEEQKDEDKMAKRTPKIVRGARTKTPLRKPRCPMHETEMEFVPEENKWKCAEDACKMVAHPKDDSPVGKVMMGKGQLDMRVIFPEPGAEPRVLLVSDNNLALDVTDYIDDMDKFLRYNKPRDIAEWEKKNGSKTVEVSNKGATLLLRFTPWKIQGCENV